MRRQRFHTERLCRVMAAVKDVQAEFFRCRISPVRAFARDERVHAFFHGLLQIAARTAGHHADFFANIFTAGKDSRLRSRRARQSSGQLRAGNSWPAT